MGKKGEVRLQGFPVSEGIAIGTAYFLESEERSIPEFPIAMGEVDDEIARYRKALFSSREDLKQLQEDLGQAGSSDVLNIVETHIQMLEDPLMTTEMEERIRHMLKNTESVFHGVISDYEKRFSKVEDVFFQERFVDVMDLARRILGHLTTQTHDVLKTIPYNSVVFAKELAPSHTASVHTARASAFVTQVGGGNSHAALIARAKGIPYVACIDPRLLEGLKYSCVIVDGQTGEVILNPSEATLEKYKQRKTCLKTSQQLLQKEVDYTAETSDGASIHLYANVGDLLEVENFAQLGAEGVGLFRTEYLFLNQREIIDSEEEQYRVYVELIRQVGENPVVIRVFDIGGDKNFDFTYQSDKEPNPMLGCRGIRFLLRHREIFKTQLRALLRAAVYGDVRILLPLISDIKELEETRSIIKECSSELERQGVTFKSYVPLGCMIEVPSAVISCDTLCILSDFLSIGTNDLVQYTLGIDRSSPVMSDAYCPTHPSVIRMIKMVVAVAKKEGKKVSVCGEIASNPQFIPLLLGLGLNEFSCSPRYIPTIKKAIRKTSLLHAYHLAHRALAAKSVQEVSQILLEG